MQKLPAKPRILNPKAGKPLCPSEIATVGDSVSKLFEESAGRQMLVSIASVMLESPRDKGSTVTPTHMHTNRDTQTRSHAHTYTCMQPHTYLVCYHTGTGVVC